jgi:hypothetical protein
MSHAQAMQELEVPPKPTVQPEISMSTCELAINDDICKHMPIT